MAFLSLLLFVLPSVAYLLWLRRNPGAELPLGAVVPALAAAALGLAGFVWYGLSVGVERGTAYVPAQIGEDGRVVPGHSERPTPPASAEAPPR